MKVMILSSIFVIVGLAAASASACGNHAEAHSDGHQITDHDHSGSGEHLANENAKRNGFSKMPAIGTKAVCPVMGNEFNVTKDTAYSVYNGNTYVFCCPGCKPMFEKDPKKYVKK